MRPVINLKRLNEYVIPHHLNMEGIHTLRDQLKRNDWTTKVDLNDAYFMIPVHSLSRSVLCFSNQNHIYLFSCLPFGLSCAPSGFTKILKPVIILPRELGVRLVAYIDDIMSLAETEEMVRDHTSGLIHLLENLGLIVHAPREDSNNTNPRGRVPGDVSRLMSNGTDMSQVCWKVTVTP